MSACPPHLLFPLPSIMLVIICHSMKPYQDILHLDAKNLFKAPRLLSSHSHRYITPYVTGPAKIGHVGTNYTPSHNMSYLSIGIE